MLKVIANRPLNLHTASTEGGLVHVPARRPVLVPDDVKDHPQIKMLTKDGTLTILGKDARVTDSYEMLAARAAEKSRREKAQRIKKAKPVKGPDEDDLGEPESTELKSNIPSAIETGENPHTAILDAEDEDEDENDEEDENEEDEDEDESEQKAASTPPQATPVPKK